MNTFAYVLILIGLYLLRAITKGRTIVQASQDLGDAFIALVQGKPDEMSKVLARQGNLLDTASAGSGGSVSDAQGADATGVPRGDIVALGHFLEAQSKYVKVSEHPAFGGVTQGAHVANSDHYKGKAIDVNADSAPGGEKAALDKVAKECKAAGYYVLWQVPDHFDHCHVADRS